MRKLTLASLLLAALLTGCGGEELANVTLIQTIGVDGSRPVELTAVDDQAEPRCYRAQGEDVAQAQAALKRLGTRRLEVTHVAQLVLGPSSDVAQTLWQEATHRESGYGATVWLVEDRTAGELLEQVEDPCGRLKTMEDNGEMAMPTVLEALSALKREGQVTLPVLTVENGTLRVAGTKTVREEG